VDPTYIVVGVIFLALVVAYFVFGRKKPAELEQPAKAPALGEKPAAKPAAKSAKPAPATTSEPPSKKAPKQPSARPATANEDEDEDEAIAEAEQSARPAPAVSEPPRKPPVPSGAPAAPSKRPGAPAPARKRDVEGLRKGLTKAREGDGFFGRLRGLFSGKKEIDPQIVERMEEVLLTSDVGVKTTEALLADVKEALAKNELADGDRVWQALRDRATAILDIGGGGIVVSSKPTVVMVVGVNGVGKTTTIGKLATKLKADGKKVVLAAGDTFRAAAVQQLGVWGKRVGCEVVSGKDGANPGAVIFDAIQKAKEIGADVVLADTAGRLHTKTNLMEELTKVSRTMAKALEGAPHETLLVLDGTNGQNAMQQAALFKESLPISGIVLTKLDGTAKGGVILGVCAEYQVPVRYIGMGERAEDLREFVAEEFVEAMLGAPGEPAEAA
jgi:fused signal recognition particle receptor